MTSSDAEKTQDHPSQRCPIDYALGIFGDRWTLLLIRDLLVRGKRRYSEFLASEEGISTNILANRLKQMQERGLLEKFADPDSRKASIYLLTDKGAALAPVMLEAIRWGLAFDEHSLVPEHIAQALAEPLQDYTATLLDSIRAERSVLQ
jgi:DNA-binding HxlR family transcriptional regulator